MSAAALRAALVTAGVARVYDVGAVPDRPTYPYAVLGVAPGTPQVRRLSGSGDPAGRFTVQMFGRTVASVTDVASRAFAAFDGKPLPLADTPVAWQEVATEWARDPDDDGVLHILHTYRY